mmetsp:Transcript_31186/g.46566  ORF Transcript_31186/g.46566 Transcript_31186/m.46566 type:complete len:204 (+) Transcript_31186:2151-2762(+)
MSADQSASSSPSSIESIVVFNWSSSPNEDVEGREDNSSPPVCSSSSSSSSSPLLVELGDIIAPCCCLILFFRRFLLALEAMTTLISLIKSPSATLSPNPAVVPFSFIIFCRASSRSRYPGAHSSGLNIKQCATAENNISKQIKKFCACMMNSVAFSCVGNLSAYPRFTIRDITIRCQKVINTTPLIARNLGQGLTHSKSSLVA